MREDSKYQEMVRDAAGRIKRSHALGEQLSLLPEPELPDLPDRVAGDGVVGETGRKAGRPAGATNKRDSQLRRWLAARGLTMPEDQLADIAGLSGPGDAMDHALERVERLMAWAYDGAVKPKGGVTAATAHQRIEAFKFFFVQQIRALDAMLPYTAPKATPDVVGLVPVPIMMPAAPVQTASAADRARDVTPQTRKMAPPPMPLEIQQNQKVSEPSENDVAHDIRTDGAND